MGRGGKVGGAGKKTGTTGGNGGGNGGGGNGGGGNGGGGGGNGGGGTSSSSSGSPKGQNTTTPTVSSTPPKTTPTTTNNGITKTTFGTPTVNPYAKTQTGRGNNVFSQSQATVASKSTSKAQPQTFTYATTKSGNTFIIPSNLSLEARQAYAKMGVATSSQPPTEASWAVDSDTQVIIDQERLANWINEGVQLPPSAPTPVDLVDARFTPNQIPKGDESTANAVQFGANTYSSENPLVADADYNWALGQNLYTGTAQDSLSVLDQATKKDANSQYLPQINDIVYPRATYEQMAQNGTNSTKATVDNFKASIESITSNKYFPFIILGFVGLIVLSIMRGGGKSSGGASAPPVQITRYG